MILFRAFNELLRVLFLCQNLTMKDIFNLYLSNDDKDILWEIMRLEERDATLSTYAELFNLSAGTVPGQTCTVTEQLPASY